MSENDETSEFEARSLHPAAEWRTTLRGRAAIRMRGTMLWFNSAKDLGVLHTDGGERIEVPGTAFMPGEKPVGRCAGKAVECESLEGVVGNISFVPEERQRRARLRHRK